MSGIRGSSSWYLNEEYEYDQPSAPQQQQEEKVDKQSSVPTSRVTEQYQQYQPYSAFRQPVRSYFESEEEEEQEQEEEDQEEEEEEVVVDNSTKRVVATSSSSTGTSPSLYSFGSSPSSLLLMNNIPPSLLATSSSTSAAITSTTTTSSSSSLSSSLQKSRQNTNNTLSTSVNNNAQQSSSHYQGVKVKPEELTSEGQSYLQSLGTYFHEISPYLPTSIKKQFPTRPNPTAPLEEKDTVLWTSFDYLEINRERHLCLIIAYLNGFQVWDVHDTENVQEIVSKREGPIKCIKFLPNPNQKEVADNPFYAKRPLLAIASAADNSSHFPNSMVKLYSLATHEYVNMLRFRTEVYSILCSKRLLIVVLKDHFYAFDSVTMEKVFNHPTFPSPSPYGVLALGSRWIAYPGNEVISSGPRSHSASDKLVEVAKDVVKDIASGLYMLGVKTFSTMNNDQLATSPKNQELTDPEYAGTVIVHDPISDTRVAHFQAHAQPLSALAFDTSGTLLVTASVDGHNFNVFQISPNNCRHIYKLQRGFTNATIQHIAFSDDSRWMTVSSSRGTTHIFAINPVGGPVSIYTHLKSTQRSGELANLPLYSTDNHALIALSACNRIKNSIPEELSNMKLPTAPIVCASAFIGQVSGSEKLYVVTQSGVLTLHQLNPHKPTTADVDPSTLELGIEDLLAWDVCRRAKWPELQVPLKQTHEHASKKDNENGESSKWLSNVEISTHSPFLRPLWANPQFTFKTFTTQPKRDEAYIFYENVPTVKVEVQHNDPMPFKERQQNNETYEVYNEIVNSASAPLSEDAVKENLFKAMSTPLESSIFDNYDPSQSNDKKKEKLPQISKLSMENVFPFLEDK